MIKYQFVFTNQFTKEGRQMTNIPEIFGSLVFNDEVMRQRLPQDIYRSLHRTIAKGSDLDINVATAVATAMKDWAVEKGATHYTHWFQPMTGVTAEKHDSFITVKGDGQAIMEFSGKQLIKGEPDASSFPSGGLRATFEARGYTAWDPTSYAFIKDDCLCIPTVFCSFSGEVLDQKTPLLRSTELVNCQALRILRLFGRDDIKKVAPMAGVEQEYFLVDKDLARQRKDLRFTGRTLFGARPPKGQELDDHYFGAIKPKVMAYMRDLNMELWKLGVYAKTEHNEVAPAQHELAPIYTNINLATDHNQLTMETMKRVAERHQMCCLLHEKPFAGVNGSGKHNNWSLAADNGENLLKPGANPAQNKQFLLFLAAVIQAVDEHQDLLRLTVASAGNDHRLGGNEAPPAVISIFLGEQLTNILEAIANGEDYSPPCRINMVTGVHVLPDIRKDSTDRNRTSPFAFTGNKFEFRMPGASMSVAGPNIILNTIIADALDGFAARLENADNFAAELEVLIGETMRRHRRIIFNGNNYSEEWQAEAERRGLLNLKTTVDAVPWFIRPENIALFTRHGIFTATEMHSRYEIMMENYARVVNIEALTMLDMANKDILPATLRFAGDVAKGLKAKKDIGLDISLDAGYALLTRLSRLNGQLAELISVLEAAVRRACELQEAPALEKGQYFRDAVLPVMANLRAVADELETITDAAYWPFPVYGELLFSF